MRNKTFFLVLSLILVFSIELIGQTYWPDENWRKSTPEKQGIDASILIDLDEKIKTGQYGYVDEMLIIKNGFAVYNSSYENDYVKINKGRDNSSSLYNYYNPEFHPFYKGKKIHTMQSVTKSVTSVLIGIAIKAGAIPGVNVKMLDYFDKNKVLNLDDRKKKMTLKNLLTMRTGFDWDETSISYNDPKNPCILMEASDDWIKFVINYPMAFEPGTIFSYNSGASQLLSAIIKKSTGMYIDEYAEKYLFKSLEIKDYFWKRTPTGYPDTEGGLYLQPKDLAKVGYLLLKNGVWKNKEIVTEEWVKDTVKPHVEDIAPNNDRNNWGYGYQWWLIPYGNEGKYIYTCSGYGGQFLYVIPEYELIAVFTGWNIYGRPVLPMRVIFRVLEAVKK